MEMKWVILDSPRKPLLAFRGIPVPHSLFALTLRRGDAKILSFRPYLDTFRVAAKSVKTMTCVLMV